ncbi:MAG: DUF4838 domain-containing protein [Phycisphaerales bacterium]
MFPSFLPRLKHRSLSFLVILLFACHAHAITLVKDGRPAARIVIAADAPASVKFAASELQNYIQQSSGAKLDISNDPATDNTIANIFLGDCDQAKAAGFDVSKLVADGSLRGVVNGNLHILGRDQPCSAESWDNGIPPADVMWTEHGTLNGVYELLENCLGVHWYLPGDIGQVVPAHTTIEVPDARAIDQPVFTDRWFVSADFLYYHNKNAKDFPDAKDYVSDTRDIYKWIMRLRWSTQVTVQGSHSVHFLDYARRFGKDHPEWFAQRPNGERDIQTSRGAYLCWSQPGLVDEMILDTKAFYAGEPSSSRGIKDWNRNRFGRYFMIDPNDGYPGCSCELCTKARAEHPDADYSEIIFSDIARIANAVNDIPGARITTLAYPPKLLPPQTVKLPSNVSVRLCIAGPNGIFRPLANQKQMQLMKDWSKRLDGDLTLWTYSNAPEYQHPIFGGAVQTLPHAFAQFLHDSRPYIKGMFYQNGQSTQTNRNLDTYVAMKLLWNPDQNVDQLLSEYHQQLYGPAADAVGRFYQRLEADWKTISTFHPEPAENLTWYDRQPATASRIELWEKVLNADELKHLDELLRQAEQSAASGDQPVYTRRVALLRQWTYGTMLSYRGQFIEELGSRDRAGVIAHRTTMPSEASGLPPPAAWKVPWQSMVSVSAKHPTEVGGRFKVLYDADFLYLLAQLDEPLMDRSATAADRKDDDTDLWHDNDIEIMIDPHDKDGTTYQLMVNDRGRLADLQQKFGLQSVAWNSGAKLRAKTIDSGWTVQLAIPLASLGLTDTARQPSFGFNVVRHRSIRDQADQFYGWCPLAKLGRWNDPVLWGTIRFENSAGESDEQIINGNMEKGGDPKKGEIIADWVIPKNSRSFVTLDEQVKAGGGRSARIHHDQPESTAIMQYLPNLKPDTTYRLRCQVKTKDVQGAETDPADSGVYLQFFAPGFNRFTPSPALRGDNDWRTVELTIKTAATFPENPVMYLRLWLRNAGGTAWFDDISIMEVSR